MKLKKIIAVLMAALLVTALTACGGNSAGQGGKDTVEVTFWYSMDGVPGEITQKQISAFNNGIGAEKGIHVTGVFQDWPGTDALTAAMSTDNTANMPDVIHMFSEYVDLIRDWERTAWAEDYITAAGSSVSKSDLMPTMASAYSLNGRMIGVPYAISTLLLYYNQDLLAQAGYDAPPATIAEMAEMIKDIAEKTDAAYGLNVRIDQYEFENFIAAQGPNGTYFGNNESGRAGNMTALACQDQIGLFLTEWQKVIDSGAYKATRDSINEEFAQGLNAMCIMSSSRIPTIDGLVDGAFEWGVAAPPTVSASDVGGGYPSGSGLFMIDRGDDGDLDAAWEFVQYMISPEAQAMWLDGYSYVPVVTAAAETDAYKAAVAADPRLDVSYQILNNAPATLVASFCPAANEVNTVIQSAMLSFADGSADRDATYNAIINGIDQAFADYFRVNPIN